MQLFCLPQALLTPSQRFVCPFRATAMSTKPGLNMHEGPIHVYCFIHHWNKKKKGKQQLTDSCRSKVVPHRIAWRFFKRIMARPTVVWWSLLPSHKGHLLLQHQEIRPARFNVETLRDDLCWSLHINKMILSRWVATRLFDCLRRLVFLITVKGGATYLIPSRNKKFRSRKKSQPQKNVMEPSLGWFAQTSASCWKPIKSFAGKNACLPGDSFVSDLLKGSFNKPPSYKKMNKNG